MTSTADDSDAAYLKRMQALGENAFVENVLIPLLQSMPYSKVEDHKGADDRGKDILAWHENEEGDTELTVIQVGHYAPNKRTTSLKSTNEITRQLIAAGTTPMRLEGKSYTPKKARLFTPHEVSAKAEDAFPEAIKGMPGVDVRIRDGRWILRKLRHYAPRLLSLLAGHRVALHATVADRVARDQLLQALGQEQGRPKEYFYTNLELFAGEGYGRLLELDWARLKDQVLEVDTDEWTKLCVLAEEVKTWAGKWPLSASKRALSSRLRHRVKKHSEESATVKKIATRLDRQLKATNKRIHNFDDEYVQPALDEAAKVTREELGLLRHKLTRSDKNLPEVRRIDRRISLKEAAEEGLLERIVKNLGQAAKEARKARTWASGEEYGEPAGVDPEHGEHIRRHLLEVESFLKDRNIRNAFTLMSERRGKSLASCLGKLDRLCKSIERLHEQALDLRRRGALLPRPVVTTSLKGRTVGRFIELKKQAVLQAVADLNAGDSVLSAAGDLLDDAAYLYRSVLDNIPEHIVQGLPANGSGSEGLKMKVALDSLIMTGKNMLVLGDAGAGKTTSLEIFAKNQLTDDKEVGSSKGVATPIFVPLNSAAREYADSLTDPRKISPAQPPGLETVVCCFLRKVVGWNIGPRGLRALARREKLVLLLDGLDETISAHPWVTSSISEHLSKELPYQVVVSCRTRGSYSSGLPLVPIRLASFSPEQRRSYIQKRLLDKGISATFVSSALGVIRSNQKLAALLCNPLMATVFCANTEEGRSPVDREARLYRERMTLLLERYDKVKEAVRINTDPEDLLHLARYLAFELQSRNSRGETMAFLFELAKKRFARVHGEGPVERAVRELADPCNIIVPMREVHKFGFGHLRYQEYLAAREISENRGVDITSFLYEPTWTDVFYLFAQMADDVEDIIQGRGMSIDYRRAKPALDRLIDGRPSLEHRRLRELLRRQVAMSARR